MTTLRIIHKGSKKDISHLLGQVERLMKEAFLSAEDKGNDDWVLTFTSVHPMDFYKLGHMVGAAKLEYEMRR